MNINLPTHPHAFGEDMDVPFISICLDKVHTGTDVIAPPGAIIQTPSEPSILNKFETIS